ncbi:hypothetical protein BJX99DRAFT_238460 [Aspergillus californicus]
MPARPHKSTLISYCTSPVAELPSMLKLLIGLEVSACTGNSRRVSLWDALRLSQVKQRGSVFCGHPQSSTSAVLSQRCLELISSSQARLSGCSQQCITHDIQPIHTALVTQIFIQDPPELAGEV